jgi:DNA replication and repair protein RecF
VRLDWLELREFRSYQHLEFHPDPGVNVLVGRNGAGKTNVLEAIVYLSALRSFRRAPDGAMVRSEGTEAIIRGSFARETGEVRVEVEIPGGGRRRVLLNGKRPKRHADVLAEIPVVAFLPDDLDLVKRGPALRREYVDDLGAHLAPTVGADQTDYEKVLRQRNSLLRREGRMADLLTLEVWDERLAEAGSRLLANRLMLLDRLIPVLRDAYQTVGGPGGYLEVTYESVWAGVATPEAPRTADPYVPLLREALRQRRERDLDQRTTTSGPHRDEPLLRLDGRDLRTQASQGEQRSAALSLRLAAYRLLEDRHGRPPILVLDDVFSELDHARVAGVRELLPRGQVFVTTARDDEVPVEGRRWTVGEGSVQ